MALPMNQIPRPSQKIGPPTLQMIDPNAENVFKFHNIYTNPFSNFHASPVTIDGREYPTVEHYYQSKKFEGTELEEKIRSARTIQEAHVYGHSNKELLRKDWEKVKEEYCFRGLSAKFKTKMDMKNLLLDTGNKVIVNIDGDPFWGMMLDASSGRLKGMNRIGEMLMRIREEIRTTNSLLTTLQSIPVGPDPDGHNIKPSQQLQGLKGGIALPRGAKPCLPAMVLPKDLPTLRPVSADSRPPLPANTPTS